MSSTASQISSNGNYMDIDAEGSGAYDDSIHKSTVLPHPLLEWFERIEARRKERAE